MEVYKYGKNKICTYILYDNRKGSALLFVTQADCLMTKTCERKYSQEDEACVFSSDTQHMAIEYLDIQAGRIVGDMHLSESRWFNADGNIN